MEDAPRGLDRIALWIGVCSGVGGVAIAILGWFAFEHAEVARAFADFQTPIPALTQLVTHPTYLRAAPIVLLIALAAASLLPRSKSRLAGVATVALVGIAAVIVGKYGASAPFRAMADLIE